MIGIPNNAKKVFKGIIFDVYQWEQEVFDGSKRTWEKLKRADTADAIAVTKDKKILLAYDEQPDREGVYTTLGGRIDAGEEALEGAKRELLEESGYVSKDWELFMKTMPSAKIIWNSYYYIARNCEKVAEQKLDGGEKIKIEAISFEEWIDVVTSDGFQDKDLSLAVFRMIKDGTLETFKNRLLK